MPTVRRYHRIALDATGATRTQQGFLRVPARLTRTGIFLYRRADGTIRRELRLPDEVFKPGSMASFGLAPLTLDHPPEPVTAANVAKYRVGTVGEAIRRDGDFMATDIVIQDAKAIEAVEAGKQEISNGYECDLDETPGTYNGEKYDAIQRAIVGNHCAIVDRGRAGPDCRLRMDAADAEQVEPISQEPAAPGPQPTKEENPMKKILIDGIECEVSELAATLIEKTRKADEEKRAAEAKAHADALSAVETKAKEAAAELEREKARADAAVAAKETAEKARKDAEDPKRIAAAVAERVDLVSRARAVMGNDFKADGKEKPAIQREMLGKLLPTLKLAEKTDAYVEAALDAAMEDFGKKNPAALARAGVMDPPKPGANNDTDEPKDAREKFMAGQNKTDANDLPGTRKSDLRQARK
jgi:uncharacterized protein